MPWHCVHRHGAPLLYWREGSTWQSGFARVQITVVHDAGQCAPAEEWLIVQWPN